MSDVQQWRDFQATGILNDTGITICVTVAFTGGPDAPVATAPSFTFDTIQEMLDYFKGLVGE